ncbi:MAG: Smr/MutS family protein [Roseiarcus sp.]
MKEPPAKQRAGRPRRLSDEEIELWIAVAKSVSRRKGAALPASRKVRPPSDAPTSREAEVAHARPAPRPPAPPPLATLDKRLRRRLARGRSAVDRSIDLHGMNQAQAHEALRRFLASAQASGERLVVVVTGKGAARATGPGASGFEAPGVLRRLVPHWLHASDLRPIVLGFEEAGRAHGGAGALYVRLRRIERSGPR